MPYPGSLAPFILLDDIMLRHVVEPYYVLFTWRRFRSSGSTCRIRCTSPSAGLPTIGDLTTWENVGKPTVVADLLKQRRDSDAAGGGGVESVVLPGAAVDGDVLQVSGRVLEARANCSKIPPGWIGPQAVGTVLGLCSDVPPHLITVRMLSTQ